MMVLKSHKEGIVKVDKDFRCIVKRRQTDIKVIFKHYFEKNHTPYKEFSIEYLGAVAPFEHRAPGHNPKATAQELTQVSDGDFQDPNDPSFTIANYRKKKSFRRVSQQ